MVNIEPRGPQQVRVLFDAAATDYLWIDPKLAGRWWEVGSEWVIAVRFPPSTGDADTDPRDAYPAVRTDGGRIVALGARLLEARVDIPASVSQWQEHNNVVVAVGQAREFMTMFLAWCKIRQPWIGAYDSPPEPLDDVLVFSPATGTGYTYRVKGPRPRPEGPQVRFIDEPALQTSEAQNLINLVAAKQIPDVPAGLLSEAYFAAFCIHPRDLKRAVLLAAFACEIRIRYALRDHVKSEAKTLFDEWFPSQGPPKKPVAVWTGKVAKKLVGRSLEEEDEELFQGLGRLVRVRNALAHEGTVPELDHALEGVRMARRVFQWLDSW